MYRTCSCAALGLLLGSCSSFYSLPPDLEQRIADAAAPLRPKIGDDDAVRAVAEAAARGEVAPPEEFALPERAGLDDYLRLAAARNPRLQARVRELEALGMRVPQDSALPDPMLSFTPDTGAMVQTAGGEMGASIGVSQGLPFPTKLVAMGKVAEQVVRIALENLTAERLRVAAEVKQAYYDLYLAHVSRDVTAQLEPLLERVRGAAESRYTAGAASQQDLLDAEVELASLQNARIDLERQQHTASARLNLLMDRAIDAALPGPAAFGPEPLQWRLQTLLARMAELSPELAALRQAVAKDLAEIALAHQQYFPDLSLGGVFTFIMNGGLSPVADGKDVWNLNLGVSLPIWFDKLRAGVLQRNAEALASALRYRSTRNDLAFALQELLVGADSAFRRAVLLRDEILPRAQQALRVAQSGYETGSVEYAALLSSWRRLLELTLDYHRALASLERDVGEVERIAGGNLPRREPQEAQS